MEEDDKYNGNKLRQTVTSADNIGISQTIYYKKSENCLRENLSEILYYFGVGFPAGNTINGKNFVISVPRTTIRIVIAC